MYQPTSHHIFRHLWILRMGLVKILEGPYNFNFSINNNILVIVKLTSRLINISIENICTSSESHAYPKSRIIPVYKSVWRNIAVSQGIILGPSIYKGYSNVILTRISVLKRRLFVLRLTQTPRFDFNTKKPVYMEPLTRGTRDRRRRRNAFYRPKQALTVAGDLTIDC